MIKDWFRHAKLGIFMHWGIYAVDGITESWSFGQGRISYDEYMKQLDGFTASKYDPRKWAALFKEAGARYAVLTTKHHDGVSLADTEHTDLNVVKRTPAGRDLLAPYCEALREEGLKVGFYFTNTDWSNVDNMRVILDKSEEEVLALRKEAVDYHQMYTEMCKLDKNEGTQDPAELETAWARFMLQYRMGIRELLTKYGNIDVMWFDVMLTRKGFTWEADKVREMIRELNPDTMVNARLVGQGDYETPELYIPLRPLAEHWELCSTFNNSWGYKPDDTAYKDIRQIVRMLTACIAKGGNLLISFGPTPEGEIPAAVEEKMRALGKWTHKYEEAIYPTDKGIPVEYYHGDSTLSEDGRTLYLFCNDKPNGFVLLNGIKNTQMKVTSLTSGRALSWTLTGGAPWLDMPGQIWIEVQEEDTDAICTVIKIAFDEPIDMIPCDEEKSSVGGVD